MDQDCHSIYLSKLKDFTFLTSFKYPLTFLSLTFLFSLLTLPINTKASGVTLDKASQITLTVSADNAEEVYFNGVRLGRSDNWKQASTYQAMLQDGENVIAVKAMDANGIAAFIADISTGSRSIVSNSSWKVTTKHQSNWHKVNFNDGSWKGATTYGQYGTGPWKSNVSGFPKNSSAQWIWSDNWSSDNTVYLRYTINVAAPLNITTQQLSSGKAGIAYSYKLSANGGTAPYSWQVIEGDLPQGLSLNSGTGEINGSPSKSETATFTVQAKDNKGKTATQELTLKINASSNASSKIALTVSADNAEEVYFNGVRLGRSDNWKQASTYQAMLQDGENVIAVKAMDANGIAAFIADISTGSRSIVSNSSWKVTTKHQSNWHKVNFNDGSWKGATTYGQYGTGPWKSNVSGFPKNSSAQWIWSDNWSSDNTVYLRYTFSHSGGGYEIIDEPVDVTTDQGQKITVNINDYTSGPVAVKIVGDPAHGRVSLGSNGRITYTPNSGYTGQDTFLIELVDQNGMSSITSVTVTVGSTTSPQDIDLVLEWNPHSSSDTVEGYLVYYGFSSGLITKQLSDLHLESGEVNAEAPSVTYNAKALGAKVGDTICFSVKAYNSAGESKPSKEVCTKI